MVWIAEAGLKKPRLVIWLSTGLTALMLMLAALPSIWPEAFAPLPAVKVDTDPENMLASDNPIRVLHGEKKDEFALYDQIVLGIVNEEHDAGVFNRKTLANVHTLTEFAKTLEGVIAPEILAPSTMDNIEQAGLGAVSFDWLMENPPETEDEALALRDAMLNLPMMVGSLIDEAGTSLMLFIPLESKAWSHEVASALLEKIESLDTPAENYHITGLPVANDTFGVQMFIQMGISAPMAMALIFILMWLFFKRLSLILSPMIVAMMSVIITMAALVLSGNTIHIMSSMIPIFIMPIAVLDAVHILSEFYDRYPEYQDKRKTAAEVIKTLWRPMLFTSLTTTAGFGSLALAPIPPVQVFGIFVALGVMLAWFFTIVFIPAYITLIPEKSLQNFGYKPAKGSKDHEHASGLLLKIAKLTRTMPKLIVGLTMVLLGIAAYGISQIVINDNPVKWFEPKHRIRVADSVLNERFAGTYPAYIALESEEEDTFKDPAVLNYIDELQLYLESLPNVGKTSSITGIIKTVYRELLESNPDYYRIPDSSRGVAQTLLTYESSHRPDDLWHFVTPDYKQASIWIQLNSGDNMEMNSVVRSVEDYLKSHPLPGQLIPKVDWFGLTYINVIWQDEMVAGMLSALLSSFVIVLILMTLLFRSLYWGLLSMIPLTITISLIYGITGLVGKAYDMPVAVLSSLSLGLAVDYAIHFLARSQELHSKYASWSETLQTMFGEPARAIVRNLVVVGVGFSPLLLAPLVPYQTVGILISAILVIAGVATLIILPALQTLFERRLFKNILLRFDENTYYHTHYLAGCPVAGPGR